jgi:hypothetical protein
LIDELNLPNNSFTVDNVLHDVPCVFQIWESTDEEREVKEFDKPDWLEYTSANKADISFRRVGVYAGKTSKDKSLFHES